MNEWYQEQFNNFLSTEYDEQLRQINGLSWLPWVGNRFNDFRILIIAESHYTATDNPEEVAANKQEYMDDIYSTREVFAEYPIHGYESGWINHAGRNNNPTFDYIFRVLVSSALLNNERSKRERLCSALAFINIVQRPMWFPSPQSGFSKERPSTEDMITGWKVIKEVISILEPNLCWFAGAASAKWLDWYLNQVNFAHDAISIGQKIGHTYPRSVNVNIGGKQIPLKFSQHPSQYFSWDRWQKYIFDTEQTQQLRTNLLSFINA